MPKPPADGPASGLVPLVRLVAAEAAYAAGPARAASSPAIATTIAVRVGTGFLPPGLVAPSAVDESDKDGEEGEDGDEDEGTGEDGDGDTGAGEGEVPLARLLPRTAPVSGMAAAITVPVVTAATVQDSHGCQSGVRRKRRNDQVPVAAMPTTRTQLHRSVRW